MTAGHPGGRKSAHRFQVWDFPSLEVRSHFEPFPPGRLASAVFAPDGEHLLTGTDNGALLIWNVAEGRIVERRTEHTGWITAITFARDGRSFATASCDRTLVLWDAATREVRARLRGHLQGIWSVAFSPDGRTLVSGSKDGTTKLWDTITRQEQRILTNNLLVTGFSSDSRRLVGDDFFDSKLWNLQDGAVTTVPLENYAEQYFRTLFTCRDVTGAEPIAVYGRGDGVLELWNLATMSRIRSWQAHPSKVATAVFSPNGQSIASSGAHGEIILWEVETGRKIRRFESLGGKMLMCTVFSRDGRLLAGSEEDSSKNSRLGLWDADSGSLLPGFPIHGLAVYSLAFSPNGKLLAIAEVNDNALLLDIPSGKLRATLKGHIMSVMSVAFSPDGKTLATGGDDAKVKLWNVATEQEVLTLEVAGGCRSVKFSPDGRILAVGYSVEPERYIRLWEVPSFEEIAAAERGRELNAESQSER